jgi:flagellar basal-body rod modification protein FlgD
MKNQDPTASTDPNQYINQLVSVNSLEQLIDINSTLTKDSNSSTSSTNSTAATSALTAKSASGTSAKAAGAHKATVAAAQSAASTAPTSRVPAAISTFAQAHASALAPGNLTVPAAKPAAQTVANALSGRAH